jgi:glycerol-3-phosphate acyltransferase PlsX
MRIALDAMGGDYAPGEIVKGALKALEEDTSLEVILAGDEEILTRGFPGLKEKARLYVEHCAQVIGMDEHPAMAYRKKKDASISVATRLVKEGRAEAVVSAGSTGAQMTAALLGLGRIRGIERPAIVTMIPTLLGPKLLLDSGANTGSGPDSLVQFAQMGHVYAKIFLKLDSPKIYLLSNGSEESKGDEAVKAAHQLLKDQNKMRFSGNIEGRDILKGQADIVVCDGFVGNVALKVMEGVFETIFHRLKGVFSQNLKHQIAAFLLKDGLKSIIREMDYSEYGGAPLLGVEGVSMVCHGSSNAAAIKNALFAAKDCVQAGFLDQLKELAAKGL